MKVRVLGSFGGNTKKTNLTNFLINGNLAIEAGCLTSALSLEEQYKITDVIISHSHMDHINSLPFLIDNLFGETEPPLRIWGSLAVLDCLKKNIFNDIVWPDFSEIHFQGMPSITFHPIDSRQTYSIAGVKVTPIPVNHIVATQALYIEDRSGAFLFSSDTCSTDEIWDFVNKKSNLKAIIVDCSFPNKLKDLAIKSGHMTPELLKRDLKKLKKKCQIFVYHAKPSFEDQIRQELDSLGMAHLQSQIQGHSFDF